MKHGSSRGGGVKWRRCWCKTTWPVSGGEFCPKCGRRSNFAPFTRTAVVKGVEDQLDDGAGAPVRIINLNEVEPGTVLDDFVYAEWDSPEMDEFLRKHSL